MLGAAVGKDNGKIRGLIVSAFSIYFSRLAEAELPVSWYPRDNL